MSNQLNNEMGQMPSFDALFAALETTDSGATDDQLFGQLNELRLWRDMQQHKLTTNQLSQRQLLHLEKEKLYEMLGLSLNSDANDSEASDDGAYATEDDGDSGTEAMYTVNNAIDDESASDEEIITPNTEIEMPIKRRAPSPPLPKPKLPVSVAEHPNAMETNDNNQIEKRPFLKRGEGLTTRFKVSPDVYRLDRLPKYKYANRVAQALSKRQPNKQKQQQQQQQQQQQRDGGGRVEGQQLNSSRTTNSGSSSKQNNNNNSNNSKTKTPEVKSVNRHSRGKLFKHGANELKLIPRKLVNNLESTNDIADKTVNIEENVIHEKEQDAVNHLPVNKIVSDITAYPSTTPLFDTPLRNKVQAQQNEINELNVFELLEQRLAHSIQSTPNNKFSTEFMQMMADSKPSATMGVQRTASIRPARCAVSQRSDPRIMKMSAEAERARDEEEQTSFYSSDEEPRHVHFASHAVRYVAPDETTPIPDETCSVISEPIIADDDDETAAMEPTAEPSASNDIPSTESFQRFKEKLFDRKLKQKFKTQLSVARDAELVEVDEDVDSTSVFANPMVNYDPTDAQSQTHPILAAELQSKSDLLQKRLAELETEISTFREQNAELTKLIREHEVIRQEFEEERQLIHDQLNDERCKIEIYLHDENMKIVNERKELDRRGKELQRPNRTERDEMVKLREQVANQEKELSARDQKHIAAQARLRAQLRNIEKEHKEAQFDLENLRRENKKLETENTRLRRQGNNKMLQEINRTIAKLAPVKQNNGENALNNNHEATDSRPTKSAKVKGAKECSNRSAHRTVVAKVTSTSRSGTPSTSSARPMRSKSVPNLQDGNDSDSASEYELRNASDSDSPDANGHTKSSYFQPPQSTRTRHSSHCRETVSDRKSKSPGATNESRGSNASQNDYKRVIENADGSKDVWYPNGNLKKISADAMFIRMMYYNKDIKETNISEGTVKYYYAETNTWHTTYMDGMEILEFPNGQNEHRLKDGTIEIYFPNGSVRITNPYKEKTEGIREEWKYLDGTTVVQKTNGDKLLMLPNGQREVHNNGGHKRREYPDGTVKIVYPDGSQESRYANGRVRLKDKDGKLVMDSETIFV